MACRRFGSDHLKGKSVDQGHSAMASPQAERSSLKMTSRTRCRLSTPQWRARGDAGGGARAGAGDLPK